MVLHTLGIVCVMIENNIISGDTLMKSLFSRTDLPGGNRIHLLSSL